MIRRAGKGFCLLTILMAAAGAVLLAQATATIEGLVNDESGAVLPGVTVVAKHLGTGLTRTVVTGDAGRYVIPQLAVGEYQLQAELPGFKTQVHSGIHLTVARVATVNFSLGIGEITEQVVVTGEAPLVETSVSQLGGLTNELQMRYIPLNLRSFEQLAALHPGVVRYPYQSDASNAATTTEFTVSGARTTNNSFLLDGTVIDDYRTGAPGGAQALLGVEAVQEFKVLTHNYAAEYGRKSGAVVTSVTKSGTNNFRGSVYAFHRNDNLDARNFFDPGKNPPEFKRNQFGATIGGPIRRDKSFFFFNYEGLRQRLGNTRVAFVPTEDSRKGIMPDGRRITVNPAVVPYLVLWPPVNGRTFPRDGTGEHFFTFSEINDADFITSKIDHSFTDRHSFAGRYTFDDSERTRPATLPGFTQGLAVRNQWLTLEDKYIISSHSVNVLRFGFVRPFPVESSGPTIAIDPNLSFIPGRNFGIIRTTVSLGRGEGFGTGSLSETGAGILAGAKFGQNSFQYSDDFSWARGTHNLKTGVRVERLQYQVDFPTFADGIYAFSSLENLLLGSPTSFRAKTPDSDANVRYRQTIYGFYVQDDYKARRNLTLNLGLRYEFVTLPSEDSGGIVDGKFIPGKFPVLKNLSDTQVSLDPPMFQNPSLKNWAPRFGLAWDPFSDGKTALRAGIGIFHNQLLSKDWVGFPPRSFPFVKDVIVNNPIFPNAFREQRDFLAGGKFSVSMWNQNWKTPTMMHYSLGIDRELVRDLVVSATYVASTGTHNPRQVKVNLRSPSTILPDGRKFFDARTPVANPFWGDILKVDTDVNSDYHSLQVNLQRRLKHGIEFNASYVFGKSLDQSTQLERGDGPNGTRTILDPFDRRRDNGRSNFDIRHNFVFSYSIDLPFGQGKRWLSNASGAANRLLGGWQLAGLVTAATGPPMTAQIGFSQALDGIDSPVDRPDLRPGKNSSTILGTPDRWFDPTVFALPLRGTYGNLGRNTIQTPGLATWDFSLFKDVRLNEVRHFQFRAEVFNLTNNGNFGLPQIRIFTDATGAILGNAGRITDTITTSRQIQFGLKFIF